MTLGSLALESIWPMTPVMVLCIVSIMLRMPDMVSIIGGICMTSCGRIASS